MPREGEPRPLVPPIVEDDRVTPHRVSDLDDVHASLRDFWDRDAPTYDRSPEHVATSAGEQAAWAAALRRLLPPSGRVLDVGAGTGFLSLAAARLGYQVTALDVSSGMLARLEESAVREKLEIETVQAPAEEPPDGPFDAVIERLAIWTLPDPARALAAWRAVAPGGRLVAFEGAFNGRDYAEALRSRARGALHRWRRLPPEHHGSYPGELKAQLPLVTYPSPSSIVEVIASAGWGQPSLERLRDVEWARSLALPPLERLLGVRPRYAVIAG